MTDDKIFHVYEIVVDWMNEHNIKSAESIYQVDSIIEDMPSFCHRLYKALYYNEDDDDFHERLEKNELKFEDFFFMRPLGRPTGRIFKFVNTCGHPSCNIVHENFEKMHGYPAIHDPSNPTKLLYNSKKEYDER
jgi:hypothetical protein